MVWVGKGFGFRVRVRVRVRLRLDTRIGVRTGSWLGGVASLLGRVSTVRAVRMVPTGAKKMEKRHLTNMTHTNGGSPGGDTE